MRFDAPYWFAAAAVALAVFFVAWRREKTGRAPRASFLFSSVEFLRDQRPTWRIRGLKALMVFDLIAVLLLTVALARPQMGRSDSVVYADGIDVMLVVDCSGSMAAEDFGGQKTRLAHVAEVMKDFIDHRESDRIGLISFGRAAYTRCPMTLDYGLLDGICDFVHREWQAAFDSSAKKIATERQPHFTPQELDQQGTAIGDALVSAVARLENSKAKSRIVILLTDGEQNAGESEPGAAADLAKSLGIKVYTIGIGTNRAVPVRRFDRLQGWGRVLQDGFGFSDKTLKEIAEKTGARYFAATDRKSLEEGYAEISRLERSRIQTKEYKEWDERFEILAWIALGILFTHAVLSQTLLRTAP